MTLQLPLTTAEVANLPTEGTFWLVRDGECTPPAEFMQACAPCPGVPPEDPTACGGAASFGLNDECVHCRIELVGPCLGRNQPDHVGFNCPSWCTWGCNGTGTVTLGHAYAVGQPLPIVLCGSGHGLVGEYVVVENARVFRIKNASLPVTSDELTAALAHYGPPESLVRKWALELRRA